MLDLIFSSIKWKKFKKKLQCLFCNIEMKRHNNKSDSIDYNAVHAVLSQTRLCPSHNIFTQKVNEIIDRETYVFC